MLKYKPNINAQNVFSFIPILRTYKNAVGLQIKKATENVSCSLACIILSWLKSKH